MLKPVDYVEVGSPETVDSAILAIFKHKPSYIGFLICAFIGTFTGAGYVSNKRAIMVDVNLPEHRGTASSLFRLTEQVGKSVTLMIIPTLLVLVGTYKQMLLIGMMFWIPSAVLFPF